MRALHDLEPRLVDADYEAAFRRVEGAKRAFVLILSDLLEPVAVRSLADAVPRAGAPSRGRRGQPGGPGAARARRRAAGGRRTTSRASSRRPTCEDARAAAAAARVRAAGRGGRRRAAGDAGARLRRRVPAGEVTGAGCSARDRPRQTTSPQNTAASPSPSVDLRPRPAAPARSPAPRGTRRARATAPSRARARRSSAPRACSDRSRVREPGHEQRVAEPQARDAADDDARELERPVRGDQPDERLAVARAEREPADDAEQQPVEGERGHRPEAEERARPRRRSA